MASASILWSSVLPVLKTLEVQLNQQLSLQFGNQRIHTFLAQRSDWDGFQRGLKAVEKLPLCTSLKLKRSPFATEEELLDVLKKTPDLSSLEISWFPLTDLFFPELTKLCAKLEKVNFAFCKEITDDSLDSLLALSSLTHIDIAGCVKITGNSFTNVKQGAPLTYLNLNHIVELSDETMQQILSVHTSLHSLFLGGCKKLTFTAFKERPLPSLEKLSLASWCLSDEQLSLISSQTPGLTFLNLNQSSGYTWKGLAAALQKWPKLEHLEFVSAQLGPEDAYAEQVKKPAHPINVIWSLANRY